MAEDLVLTPGGYRPSAQVYQIEPGHVLDGTNGHYRQLDTTGKQVADFGPIATRPGNQPLMPGNVQVSPGSATVTPGTSGKVPGLGSGWITYADWTNNTGNPISSFSTTWVVPPAPSSQSGQTIFLFNGIQNSTFIYQPVLQWGSSAAGGGNYWSVASWYVDGQGGPAFHSPLTTVNPGQTLTGVMTLTGQSGSGFSYNCVFEGISNSAYAIQNVQQLTFCAETLECYGLSSCSDYPANAATKMTKIAIKTGNTTPAITWSPVNAVTDCEQHCTVVSNSATDGEVDLYYDIYVGQLVDYFFSGAEYIRVQRGDTGPGEVDEGYPAPIANWGWGAFGKNGIDAALNSGSKCYFFSGEQYIRVTRGTFGAGTVDPGYPAPIADWNWGSFGKNGIDAALHSGSVCYFFSGAEYIRVTRGDTGSGTVDPGYPAPISNWGWGAFGKNGIDGALYSGPKCYFFSGDQYIRVTRGDTGAGTVDPGYPAPISNWGWGAFGKNGINAALDSGDQS